MGFPHRSPSKGYRFSGVVTTTAFLPVPVNDPLGGPGSDSADAVCETLGRSPISEGRGVSGCRAAQMTGWGVPPSTFAVTALRATLGGGGDGILVPSICL